MQFLAFILLYPVFWFISVLPMRILFIISDVIYVIIYYIIGYRKKIVRHNLKLCFPEKSDKELLDLEKKSYQQCSDPHINLDSCNSIVHASVSGCKFDLKLRCAPFRFRVSGAGCWTHSCLRLRPCLLPESNFLPVIWLPFSREWPG